MSQRFDVPALAPDGYQAMLGVHKYVNQSGLDLGLLELVRLRISQINGCAFCVAMHIPLARQHGIGDDQLNLLAVWREAPNFTAAQRAALAWGEALTYLAGNHVDDAVYAQLCEHFTPKEIADLSFMIAEINGWNRLMAASQTPPKLG